MHETDAPEMCGEGLAPRRCLWWLFLCLPPMVLALSGAASWAAREAPALAPPLSAAASAVPDPASWPPVRDMRIWWRGGR